MTERRPRQRLEVEEVAPSVIVIRFNNPAEHNSLSIAALLDLKAKLSALLSRKDIETIIVTGTDDVFASGANIRELTHLNAASAEEFAQLGQNLFQSIAGAPHKTIAAINGYCMGGGLDLALACDIRIASVNAKFSHPGARLGIITGWGGTQRLPRLIGKTRALELFATARVLDAEEAQSVGLVDEVSDPVLERALQLARESA